MFQWYMLPQSTGDKVSRVSVHPLGGRGGGARSMLIGTLDRYVLPNLGLMWAAECCVFRFI
jgi:hypothetical protein